MKKVYFVRHGESVGNKEGVFKNPDAEMIELGHEQAKRLAERCKELNIEEVFSSPNRRAVQTAEYITEACGLSFETKPYFAATKYASSMVGKSKTGPEAQEYMRILVELYQDSTARFEDAENFSDLKTRFTEGFNFLSESSRETILVVTHESILKSILLHVVLSGEQTVQQHVNSKKAIAKFDHFGFTEMKFDDGKWKLVAWNDHAHFAE